MTGAEWLACTNPDRLIDLLRTSGSSQLRPLFIANLAISLTQVLKRIGTTRKLRLFCCACYRRLWMRFPYPDADWNLLLICERYAEGKMQKAEFKFARKRASARWLPIAEGDGLTAICHSSSNCLREVQRCVFDDEAESPHGRLILSEEAAVQCDLIRDIFGNPFRPLPHLHPSVLAWNDATVRRIAEGIHEERRMPEGTLDTGRLAILADALLDAGCNDEELIAHCRSDGPHVRGCYAIDQILGKS